MYLKNLTVLGFKSFADKTSLNFLPGVTAIVGPNGCGKSNVSDAIRWVLGEQSAKALRGGEMADVIFNGTDGRKPMGMAEVSLTIGGVDEDQLTAAGVGVAYNEVTLTRRVFRDGGSEYFINKTPCRLKDIQQLFMGTGVGRASYSIMAQGNITQILSSKPDDRRMVFEEAAGITKFKAQKRESLRKLESTDQNLLRVADLIREVKRQIGSLQRQAGKARRYKQLMGELQHLETQLARHQFDILKGEIQSREAKSAELRSLSEQYSEGVLRKEDEIAQLRERLSALDHEISQTQQRALELRSEIERHESRVQYNEERTRELDLQNGKALGEMKEAEGRRLDAQRELSEVAEKLSSSLQSLELHRVELEEKKQALAECEREMIRLQEEVRKAQAETFVAAQQLTRVRNEITALDLQKQGNVIRLEKLSAEKVQLEEERVRLEVRLSEFAANVEVEKLSVQTQRGTVEQRQTRLREIQQDLIARTQELDQFLRQQAEHRSRLTLLAQLDESHEGFSAGAQAALKNVENVLGSLTDHLRVSDPFVVPVEVALGQHLQLILTREPESAREILGHLTCNKSGRAAIAALSLGSSEEVDQGKYEGVGTPALSVIESDAEVKPLLRRLLGRTVIVPDLETATSRWKETEGQFDFVTQAGDLLSREGVFIGGYLNGSGSGKAPSSILGRKNQIAELEAAVRDLEGKINEASRSKGALLSEQTELQASLQEAQSDLRTQEVAIATRQGEFKALENSGRVLHQKIDTVVYEIQALGDHAKEGEEKRVRLAQEMVHLEGRERELLAGLATSAEQLDLLRLKRDGATGATTESKVAFASEEQVCSALKAQQGPLERRIQELSALLQQRHQEMAAYEERMTQAGSEIALSRQKIEALQHDRTQVNAQAAALGGQREAEESEIDARDEQLKQDRQRLNAMQQERSGVEVELAQKNMSVQNLRERIAQKYQLALDDIRSECITITVADEGPARVETLSPEEMAAAGASTDWNAISDQVSALQKRIDEMGPVNLVAIEEYEETEQRHAFLSSQYDDLVKAKEQLLEVINKINTQTKEMFTETFNKIRDNFRTLFTEVFGGGKADLVLVDEGDVLESGIEIVARPPGKQLQSISLLSGGEQTMTAVALLFSIYQVKPSPFCVLDELDAPLDESNINRFIRVLQRFLSHSQFVIITHNKRTIGMADVLYGVTMQEHGVSKIVSVKFHKADEEVRAESRPLVPTAPIPAESSEPAVEDVNDFVMAK